jgi:tripartite ATP-independent transporter DctM subunit
VPQKVAQAANSFPILAAPLFVLMGNIMNSGGITERIFGFAAALVGWMRGGLCHANILASIIFAGMSGSAVADAGGVGSLEIKAMRDEGYDAETAAAITAASATIGPIIPPSLPMVIYGVTADVSIGGLFLAGVIPGLLMGVSLMLMVAHVARRRNLPRHPFPTGAILWTAFRRSAWALMTPVILFGGMMSGLFTPTEAAAVATVYALILGLVIYREFDLRELPRIVAETVETTGRRPRARDDRGGARLVPVLEPHPADDRPRARGLGREPPRLHPARQRDPARDRALHGGARRHADPDPDPGPGRQPVRHRPGSVRD